MTANEFVSHYNMHDSLIEKIEVLDSGKTIILWIDFAFWMQQGYSDSNPETGTLKVTFKDVADFSISERTNWDEISILETTTNNGYVKFALMNDMTDAYLEIHICAKEIIVEGVQSNY